jgi:hypothetical protein
MCGAEPPTHAENTFELSTVLSTTPSGLTTNRGAGARLTSLLQPHSRRLGHASVSASAC